MKTNSQLRAAGRADLSGRWTEAAMLTFVYFLITGSVTALVGGGINLICQGVGELVTFLLLPLGWGYSMTYLALHRGEDNDPFDIGNMCAAYKNSDIFFRIFSTEILVFAYTLLWTLLLIVPGIIKAMSYGMTPYILRDRPDLKNNEAIALSMAMMQGRKMKLFLLELSFIGWGILCLFTLGIGFFWLLPYMYASHANFYEEARREFENGGNLCEAEVVKEETDDNYQK